MTLLLVVLVAGLGLAPGTAHAAPAAQLNTADMTLLNGVRLAGLWEMPAGQMAAEKGRSRRVREVGAEISRQHGVLDQLVVPPAQSDSLVAAAGANIGSGGGAQVSTGVVWAVFLLALLTGGYATWRILRRT